MAALTGVMTADFTQFRTEVDRSVVKLQEFENAAGPQGATGSLTGFADSLGTADRLLGAAGVRIGPQIAALRELGAVAGLTATSLGAVGTASVVAGTAMAAWQLGRMIADWGDLDKTIANATSSLMGWGNVASQEAAAKTDTLRLAAQYAGRVVLDLDEALKIIKQHNAEVSESFNTGAERVRQWTAEIEKVRASGALPQIEAELKAGTSTLKELAQHYDISTRALEYYLARKKSSTAILDEWRKHEVEALEAATKAQLALNAAVIRNEPALGTLKQFMTDLPPEIKKAGEMTMFFDEQLMASIATVEEAAVPALEKLETTFRSVTEAAREAAEPSKNAPGSVGVDLGGVGFGSIDVATAMKAYTARFQGGSLGAIGGGPAPDFLSWAMKMGYASKGGTAIQNTFNVVDTESEIARRVSEEISRQIQRGSLVT